MKSLKYKKTFLLSAITLSLKNLSTLKIIKNLRLVKNPCHYLHCLRLKLCQYFTKKCLKYGNWFVQFIYQLLIQFAKFQNDPLFLWRLNSVYLIERLLIWSKECLIWLVRQVTSYMRRGGGSRTGDQAAHVNFKAMT